MIHMPRKDGLIPLHTARRKRRSRVFHSASIIGERNERTTPNTIEIQKHATCPRVLLNTLILLFIGTCSAGYLMIFGARDSLGTTNYTNNPLGVVSSTSTPSDQITWSRGAKVVTVDRSILDKLEYLHESSGDFEELDLVTWNGRWPPLVTHIPEPRLSFKKSIPYAAVMELCGPRSVAQNPCRFLLPYRISEQESKARQHFLQIVALAQALNRILVLPNLGKGRMGICLGLDFDAYYDTSSLEELGIPFAKLDIFKAWVDSRQHESSAVLMVMAEKSIAALDGLDHESPNNRDYAIRATDKVPDIGCVKTRFQNLNFVKHGAISLDVIYPRRDTAIEMTRNFVKAVQNAIKVPDIEEANTQQPEILVIDWNLRHAIFPSSVSALRYSPRFAEVSSALMPPEPYLAIHWRTESVPHENLPSCAYALVDKVRNILRDSAFAGLGTIWLASDISFEQLRNPLSKSGTLKMLTTFHHEAVRIVLTSFHPDGELAQWKLRSLEQSLNNFYSGNDYDTAWLNDSGVRGILDKIIATEATLFIGGTRSSYTHQIIEMRKKSQKSGATRQRNVIDLFG